MTFEQFCTLIKEKVSDDKLVELNVPHALEPHANGLYKHGEFYYYYEPNEEKGEYKSTSLEKIAKIVFNTYCKSTSTCKIGFTVYDFEDEQKRGYIRTIIDLFFG
jgi:hypothetical protein